MESTTKNTTDWVNFFKDAGIKVSQALQYAMIFTDNEIRKDMLLELNKDHLRDMGIIPLGHVIAILKQAKLAYNQELVEKAMFPSLDVRQTLPVKPLPPLSRAVVNTTSKPNVKVEQRKTVANTSSKSSSSKISATSAPNRKSSSVTTRPMKQNVQRQVIYEGDPDDDDEEEEEECIGNVQEDVYEMELSEVAVPLEQPVSRSLKSSVTVAPTRKFVAKKRKVIAVPSTSRTITSSLPPLHKKARIPLLEEEEEEDNDDPVEVSSTAPQVKKCRPVPAATFSSEAAVSRLNQICSSISNSRNEGPKFLVSSSTSKSKNEGPKFTLSSISSSQKPQFQPISSSSSPVPKFTITGLEKLTKDPEKTCMTSVFSRLGGKHNDRVNLEDEMEEEVEDEKVATLKSKPLPYAGILKKSEAKKKVAVNKVSKTMIADKVTTKTVVAKRLGTPSERIVSSSNTSFQVVKKFPTAGIFAGPSGNVKLDVKSRLGMGTSSVSINKPKRIPIIWTEESTSNSSFNARTGLGSSISQSKRISVPAPIPTGRVSLKDSVSQRNRLVQARSRSVSPRRAKYSVRMADDSAMDRRMSTAQKSVTFGTVTENFFEKECSDVFSRLG